MDDRNLARVYTDARSRQAGDARLHAVGHGAESAKTQELLQGSRGPLFLDPNGTELQIVFQG